MPLSRTRLHHRRDGADAGPDRVLPAADPCRAGACVLPRHRLGQARRRAQGHGGPARHAEDAPGRDHHAAAATARPAAAAGSGVRPGDRPAGHADAGNAGRGSPDPPGQGHRCRPSGQCRLERIHRPLALPRLHAPDRCTVALCSPGPGGPAAGHARLLGRRLEDRTPR